MPLQKVGQNRGGSLAAEAQQHPRVATAAAAVAVDDSGGPGQRDLNSDEENAAGALPEEREGVEDVVEGLAVTCCCLPGGCTHPKDVIVITDPCDAVKIICNNDACTAGEWMHGDCFQEWEKQVLAYLRSCGRARSWSEKQRLQNLWTKKGYDLAFKACDCKCAKGHIRKDMTYIPPPAKNVDAERRQKKGKKGLKMAGVPSRRGSTGTAVQAALENLRHPLRVRTTSLCSTGSSPPSSEGWSPQTPGAFAATVGGCKTPTTTTKTGKFEFFANADQAAAGNIFWKRRDLSAFRRLPSHCQNPYQIKIEDEGPHGNDEIRSFILTTLSAQKLTDVQCIVCRGTLPVYDKYPLIDGTFFLSPIHYPSSLPVQSSGNGSGNDSNEQVRGGGGGQHLNAVCMYCLNGASTIALSCRGCKTFWSGSTFIIGTMYSFDIFAANPCCTWRMTCTSCNRPTVESAKAYPPFYSSYSRQMSCPHCGKDDYHLAKSVHDTFCPIQVTSQELQK